MLLLDNETEVKPGLIDWLSSLQATADVSPKWYFSGYILNLCIFNPEAGFKNIYISGYNYSTLKYNRIGELKWYALNALSGQAEAIAVSETGNVFITGISKNNTGKEVTTIKYSTMFKSGFNWI